MNKEKDGQYLLAIKKPKLPKLPKISGQVFKVLLISILIIIGMILSASGGAYVAIKYLKTTGDYLSSTTNVYNVSAEENVTNIVEDVSKSVVSISTKNTSYGWFGQRYISEGAGTGIIINKNGYILTNNHVIDGSDAIKVMTWDESTYDAKLVKNDTDNDLALIKITTEKVLHPAKIGNSDEVRIGEAVIAIGNVLGKYSWSVSKGVVSGLSRPIITSGSGYYGEMNKLEDLIQTDTAINSGNSGGPLVNMKSEVIGINTAIDGSAQNIGFAVPISHASNLLDLIEE
ncbi:MAG: trypsin-like peptidase domain-containing protein [Candidatus Gastranaerophilales bacterium]|nr:trypsin-like peptidase domain-containing protein [Candidatus Gastranaerophilales bacterium]